MEIKLLAPAASGVARSLRNSTARRRGGELGARGWDERPEGSERIEWWRLPELPGTEILLVERSPRLWRVYHETYTIRTCLDSAGAGVAWTYRRKVHYTTARSCMLMEPGELHVTNTLTRPGRVNFRVLMLSPSLVEGHLLVETRRHGPDSLAKIPVDSFDRAFATRKTGRVVLTAMKAAERKGA